MNKPYTYFIILVQNIRLLRLLHSIMIQTNALYESIKVNFLITECFLILFLRLENNLNAS